MMLGSFVCNLFNPDETSKMNFQISSKESFCLLAALTIHIYSKVKPNKEFPQISRSLLAEVDSHGDTHRLFYIRLEIVAHHQYPRRSLDDKSLSPQAFLCLGLSIFVLLNRYIYCVYIYCQPYISSTAIGT